ncbi:MAG: hypothetical protein F4X44_11090 [Gammaproteobacteria bacterium]|nr:hypothetical protein [Gammaproteobacteria bacterium]MYD81142.1 hypothetical protein [Gammaproteobacteria bacterium]
MNWFIKRIDVSKPAIVLLVVLLCTIGISPQEQSTELHPDSEDSSQRVEIESSLEEVIVEGIQEEVLHAFQFDDFHEVNRTGEHYYLTRQYKKAFPYLLASAKRGFKMAQARLGYIYLGGLGGVKKSLPTAIGWIGVAAEPRSDPQIKNYFKRIMRAIPEDLKDEVQEVVDAFIERYGTDATGMSCIHTRIAGTHISTLTCNFKNEFTLRDAMLQEWMSTAFAETSGPFGTGIDTYVIGSESPDAGGTLIVGNSSQQDLGISNSSVGTSNGSGNSGGSN